METQEKIESLIRQVTELPEEAQAEVVQSLLDLRSQHLGIYQLDQEERAALSHSAEDVRLGRFASDEEIEEVFAHFGASDCSTPTQLAQTLPQFSRVLLKIIQPQHLRWLLRSKLRLLDCALSPSSVQRRTIVAFTLG